MNASDSELLQQFVRDGSESAFTEILRRHVDLVFSAAIRQVGSDPQAAEDVAQAVFTDLARKARRLTGHPSLTGWLYSSTRVAATQHRRSESRRLARETAAHAMSQILSTDAPEPDWDQLRPALDEAMHDLNEADREAVLLRFFEKRPLAEVGTRLGLSENTARMRVDRALDKLHAALAKRGITSTAAALGVALGAHAVAAAPVGIVERIGPAAMAGGGATLGGAVSAKLVVAALLLLLGIGGLMWTSQNGWSGFPFRRTQPAPLANAPGAEGATNASGTAGSVSGSNPAATTADATTAGEDPAANTGEPVLKLTFLAKDSGKPVPNVSVKYRGREGKHYTNRKFTSTRMGEAAVRLAPGTAELELTSEAEGFADTKLRWAPERGSAIPASYTVKLERAALIGGTVVDPDGQPIAGAKVGWNHEEDGSEENGVESLRFGWIETETDAEGHWQIHRIADAMLTQIHGGATHPEYQPSVHIFTKSEPGILQQLRDRTHVFKLKPASLVQGIVVSEAGDPIAGADVLVGQRGFSGSREAKTEADGTFEVHGGIIGPAAITAEAKGYSPKMIQVELAKTNAPVRLVLGQGTPLRMRVVNRAGQPVPKAYVWLNTMDHEPRLAGAPSPQLLQASFEGRSDAEGRVVWNEAPAGEHHFDVHATGYMRTNHVAVPADGQEHVVTLLSALVLQGSVTDSTTGKPVPKFRVALGWPNVDPQSGQVTGQFSPIERFWLSFAGGAYKHTLEEEVIMGGNDPRCILKFEADGYVPQLSRPVRYDEGVVILNIALEKATEVEVTILDPSGRPAPGADVGLIFPGAGLKLSAGRLTTDQYQRTGSLKRADGSGKLNLMKDPQVSRIVIAHPSGYLETSFAALEAEPTIRLQPWGRIEGEYLGAANARSGKVISLGASNRPFTELAYDFTVTTDAEGHFAFNQAPSGKLRVQQMVINNLGNGSSSSTPGQAVETEVTPGETARVTLGGGYRVFGQLRFPPGFTVPAGAHCFGQLMTPFPEPPAGIRNDPVAFQRWAQSPEIQELARNVKQSLIAIQTNGLFAAESVSAGNYSLNLIVFPPLASHPDNTKPMVPLLKAEVREIQVPAEPAMGEINLGEIPGEVPNQ